LINEQETRLTLQEYDDDDDDDDDGKFSNIKFPKIHPPILTVTFRQTDRQRATVTRTQQKSERA